MTQKRGKKLYFRSWKLVNLILSHPLRFLKGGKGTTIADPREISVIWPVEREDCWELAFAHHEVYFWRESSAARAAPSRAPRRPGALTSAV
jgi:hypothetical protein